MPAEITIALNGISHFLNPGLARDVLHDLLSMFNNSRVRLQKRAILASCILFLRYTEALSTGFSKLRLQLDNQDIG